ncbi:MAG: carboxypeptidase regulatory-like domain-containing protein [Chloroflexota bacterium]
MRRRMSCTVVLLVLVSSLLVSLLSLAAPVVHAQDPPVRPTLAPAPTEEAVTPPQRDNDDDNDDEVQRTGRITGTVIDATTGAPTAGVVVQVGDQLVTTDSNGNYDLVDVIPGAYEIMLQLEAGQGTPEQDVIMVDVEADETVVQHLAFRSQVAPTAAPTTPVPTVTPVVAELPNTSGPQINTPPASVVAALPRTGSADNLIMVVLLLGGLFLTVGGWLRRRR